MKNQLNIPMNLWIVSDSVSAKKKSQTVIKMSFIRLNRGTNSNVYRSCRLSGVKRTLDVLRNPFWAVPCITRKRQSLRTFHWKNSYSISFQIEWDMIVIISHSKGKLSPPSYPIQCERKWKYSFLSVYLPGIVCPVNRLGESTLAEVLEVRSFVPKNKTKIT